MKFCSLKGVFLNVPDAYNYLIDWEGESLSKFQRSVKFALKPFWENDLVFEEFPLVGSRLKFDFYNQTKKIALEVSGHQHYTYSNYFHSKKSDFVHQVMRDEKKSKFCELNHINFIEIFEYESKQISPELFKNLKLI